MNFNEVYPLVTQLERTKEIEETTIFNTILNLTPIVKLSDV